MNFLIIISIVEVVLLSLVLILSFKIKSAKKVNLFLGILFLLIGEIVFFVFYNKAYILGTFLQDFILFLFTLGGYFLLLLGFKDVMK